MGIPAEESVSAYLRIPKQAHAMMSATAEHLGLPLSKVVSAVLRFTLAPAAFRSNWPRRVKVLRDIIEAENGKQSILLYDFTEEEWDARNELYSWLEKMGLVEDLHWKRILTKANRVICTFRISETGRVIADLFTASGFADDFGDDELQAMYADDGSEDSQANGGPMAC